MEKEIIDWYTKRRYPPYKVITVGMERFDFTKKKVEAAMVHCYHKIQGGKPIEDISIARYVFNVARDTDCSKYEKEAEVEVKKQGLYIKRVLDLKEKHENNVRDLKESHKRSVKEITQLLHNEASKRIKEHNIYLVYISLLNILGWLFFLNWR